MHEKGIETFLAVAMSRTLGKAAELLNVTQSTISYNLSELESEMGMILVDRQKGQQRDWKRTQSRFCLFSHHRRLRECQLPPAS